MKALLRSGIAMALLAGAFMLGYLAHRNDWIPQQVRNAFSAQPAAPARPFAGDAFPLQHRGQPGGSEERDAILAMGYLQGTQPATNHSGVTQCDESAVQPGLNLYTSGHAPEAVLMDMHGKTLHTWRHELAQAWPDYSRPEYIREAALHSWRRARLYPNGDLLAIFEGVALLKLDKDSRLKWIYKNGCHHDVAIAPSGDVLVLTSMPRDGSIDNGVAILSPEGAERAHFSILDCFRASPYAPLLDRLPKHGDVLHVNTLKILDGAQAGEHPAFKAGNLLISSLTLDTIAVIDPETKSIPWAISGLTRAQHEPTLLANGNLLVFDNRGAGELSRVLELNPLTQQVVWQHPDPQSLPFYSQWCGAAMRLDNGNTLITETDNGRAFEVTHDHRIVWEFVNPNQFEERGVRMVAALFDVVRLPEMSGATWFSGDPP